MPISLGSGDSAPKRRKRIPHSNSHTNGETVQESATAFSLSKFVFGPNPRLDSPPEETNDNLFIEHYRPAPHSYSGAQRRGIVESFPLAPSYEEHIKGALQASFPLHEPAPLPLDLELALKFNRDSDPSAIREFRSSQMKWLRTIAEECTHITNILYRKTPAAILPATGKIHIALLSHLMEFTRMGGRKWVTQFATGFPMTGCLSQMGVFPLDPDTPTTYTDPKTLFSSNRTRFMSRSLNAVSKKSQCLWDEALEQVNKGWLWPPEPLSPEGAFIARPEEECNIAFRFGVQQSDKLRGCDDLRDSLTNTACVVRTPITLPGWDHIAASARILNTTLCEWSFGKVDHKSAYKALPLRAEDSNYAVIALWNPLAKAWYGSKSRTQLFGSTAAVLHYNCFSRIIASLLCRILAIPTVGYFDDFGFFTRTANENETMAFLLEFLSLLGVELKTEKSAIGNSNVFLGLTAFFPRPSNGMSLVISLPREKAHHWAKIILEIIATAHLSHATLESLIGRLSFAQTSVFGRFARAMLKPLYAKLFSPRYHPQLSLPLLRNLQWWASSLLTLTPRVATLNRSSPDWVIYTDAAFMEGQGGAHIAAIFMNTAGPFNLQAQLVLTGQPTPSEIAFFQNTSTIFGLELTAAFLAIFTERHRLRGKAVTLYMDNNAALAALVNGDSTATAAFQLIATLWYIVASFDIALWLERVDTALNIADLPTRNRTIPFPILEEKRFPPLSEALECYNQWIAIHTNFNAPQIEDQGPYTATIFE